MKFEPDGNVTSFGELTDFHIVLYVKRLGAILVHFNLTQEIILIFKLSRKDVVILHTQKEDYGVVIFYILHGKYYIH